MTPRSILTSIGASLALMLLLPASSFAGDWALEGWVKRTSTWKGFGVGTVIHHRTTEDMVMPGMPGGGRKTVTETKKTLIKITDSYYVLKVETLINGKWVAAEEKEPKVGRKAAAAPKVKGAPKIEALGEESITVEGKSYLCKKKTVSDLSALIADSAKAGPGKKRPGMGAMGKSSGTVWEHEKLGILKVQMTMNTMGQDVTTTLLVTRLSVSHKVGATTLTCRETTMTNSMMKGKTLMLQSAQVPGRTVRTTRNMQMGGMTMTYLEELVGFTKKAAAPTTGK